MRFLIGLLMGVGIGYGLVLLLDLKSKLIDWADPRDPLGATATED